MINHNEWLSVAEKLVTQSSYSNPEIYYRLGAGRAYYFIFHHVKLYFGHQPSKYISHSDLIQSLKRSKNKNDKSAYVYMKNCKNLREIADYRCDILFTQNDTLDAIRFAEKIQNLLP